MLDKRVPHFQPTEVGMFLTKDGEGFVAAEDYAELKQYAQFLEDHLLLATMEADFHELNAEEQKNMKVTAREQRDKVTAKLQELRQAVLAYGECSIDDLANVSEKYDAMLKLAQGNNND